MPHIRLLKLAVLGAVGALLLMGCAGATAEAPPPTRTPNPQYAQTEAPTVNRRSSITLPAGQNQTSQPTENFTQPTPVPTRVVRRCVTIVSDFGLNVRSGPGTQFGVQVVVTNGEQFPYLGQNPNGTWYQIDAVGGGSEAWVSSDFAELETCRN